MKTQSKGLARFLKKFATISILSALIVSCGQDNRSGNGNNVVGPFGQYGGIQTAGGNLSGVLGQIANENPCRVSGGYYQGQQFPNQNINSRQQPISVALPYSVAPGTFVGVTAEGDIAVISSNGGQGRMDLHLCNRPTGTSSAQIDTQQVPFVVNTQPYGCPVNEITSARVLTNNGYRLELYPIHIPHVGKVSSLCQGGF
ncbi:MAG: hypothetical protein N4A33_03055 [Bacteriovoracaceae bacterium]|nr:hypothetical protein [Bacteriovoracaceae bacterium]